MPPMHPRWIARAWKYAGSLSRIAEQIRVTSLTIFSFGIFYFKDIEIYISFQFLPIRDRQFYLRVKLIYETLHVESEYEN